ncbi:MAG: type II toxin-antitoxin system VapB family antitoxin [Acidobacteriota bacterium]|nr:type II toxin-antitoxin system VapB family antitoxin [Acidobacteriota bacterium]
MSADSIKHAKLFRNGNSQAVRLPQEFQFPGTKVRVRRVGTGVLLEPETVDLDEWLTKMHSPRGGFEIERDQPVTPDRETTF